MSGTPIVGYDSSYVHELVGTRGGALTSKVGDTESLAAILVTLANDRETLRTLTVDASKSRSLYSAEAVFAHRSELIKAFA